MIISHIRRAVAGLPDQTIPEPPINFEIQPGDTEVRLTWFRNEEPDVVGYNIYRSLSSGSGYSKIVSLTTDLEYLDTGRTNGVTYYYVITAEDEAGNESAYSVELEATPVSGGAGSGVAYLYYRIIGLSDNTDSTARSVWREIEGYESNDNTGTNVFNDSFSEAISSSAPNEDHLAFDGSTSTYWDSFNAASGNHRWIGLRLTSAKTVRSITMTPYAQFWQPASMKIQGSQDGNSWVDLKAFNTSYNTSADTVVTDIQGAGTGGPPDTTPPADPTGLVASPGNTAVSLSWNNNTEGDLDGYNIYRSLTSGSGYSKLNTNPVTSPAFTDTGLTNGVTYYYVITAVDTALPANESGYSSEVSATPVGTGGDINVLDVSWCSVQLSWTQDTATNDCVIIQRKTHTGAWTNPSFNSPLGWANYKRLGSKAFNYWDLDVEPGTTYYYRVSSITNASAWSNTGATPTLTTWKEGNATTPSVTFQTFNVTSYGADPTGTSNSYQAIVDCYAAARVARTATNIPVVRFPNNGGAKATYLSYPTDSSVQLYGGTQNYVTYANRDNWDSYLFTGVSNIVIEGQLSTAGERPELRIRQWNNQDSTNWLARLSSTGTDPTNNAHLYTITATGSPARPIVRHGFMALSDRTENLIVRDIHVNGTGYPVNRGKEWYSAEDRKHQWDVTHKGIAAWNAARNIICDNVKIDNFRAECFYVGGRTFESWRMANCQIGNTNSSAISMSAAAEIENCDIYDASNAGVESAIFEDLTSVFNGETYTQYHLIWDSQVHCLDQRNSGVFKNLPGATEFGGFYIFNEPKCWWDIANTNIHDMVKNGVGGWYGCFNASSWRLNFINTVEGGWAKNFFYHTIFPFPTYLLAGGMEGCYFLETEVNLNAQMENGSRFLYTLQGNSVSSASSNNVVWDNITFKGNGFKFKKLWTDQWGHATGRSNFTFKNWSYTNMTNEPSEYVEQLSGGAEIQPYFENVNMLYAQVTPNSGQVRLKWNHTKINGSGNIEIIQISKLKEEQPYTLSTNGGTVTLPSAAWNTWGVNQTIGAGQTLQVQRASGTSQLELV